MKQYQFIFTYEIFFNREQTEIEIPFIINDTDLGEACMKADVFVDEYLHNFKTESSTIRFVNCFDWEEII